MIVRNLVNNSRVLRTIVVAGLCLIFVGCKNQRIGSVEEVKLPVTVKFTENILEFQGQDGTKLQGTLMVPAGSLSKSYPCVLLISGSGPTDQNGNAPGLKIDTMKQFAIGLAGADIASFRFDKRAVARYAANWPTSPAQIGPYFSWKNHLGDALGAWKRMRAHGLVDPDHCAVLGHSEGGMIALSIAPMAQPKAIVLLSTPGRSYDVLIHEQLAKNLAASGAEGQTLLKASDRIMAAIKKTGTVPDDVPAALKGLFNPSVGVFFQQACHVNPAQLAGEYRGPVLVLNGESDVQVSAERDAKALFAAVKSRKGSEIVILPLASHNLKSVEDEHDPGLKGPVVPDAIESIDKFLVPKIGGTIPNGQLEVDLG